MLIFVMALLAQDSWEQIGRLERDIETLRMLHRIKLDAGQKEKILDAAKKSSEGLGELIEVEKQMKAEWTKGQEPPEELQRKAHELRPALEEARNKAAEKIRGLLTEEQIKTLISIRAGGPGAHIRQMAGHLLDESRKIPDQAFDENFPNALKEHLTGILKHLGEASDQEIDDEVDRVLKIFREAREADDDAFTKKRDAYVEKIAGEGKLGKAPQGPRIEGDQATRIVGDAFLNPDTLRLLRGD